MKLGRIFCPYCKKFMLGNVREHQNCDLNKLLEQATKAVRNKDSK